MKFKSLGVQALLFTILSSNGLHASLHEGVFLSQEEAKRLMQGLGITGNSDEGESEFSAERASLHEGTVLTDRKAAQEKAEESEIPLMLQSTMFNQQEASDIKEAWLKLETETKDLMRRSIEAQTDIAQIKNAHVQEKREGQELSGRLAQKKKDLALQLLLWEKLIADMDKKIDELINLQETALQQAKQKQTRLLQRGKTTEAQRTRFIDDKIIHYLAEQTKQTEQLKQRRDELEIKLTDLKKELAGIIKKEILSERRAKRRAQEELAKQIKLTKEGNLDEIIEEFEKILPQEQSSGSSSSNSDDIDNEFEIVKTSPEETPSAKKWGWLW